MRSRVIQAFKKLRANRTPYKIVARDWFVADDDGELFPLKSVWAVAQNTEPKLFNTKDARIALTDLGFMVVRLPREARESIETRNPLKKSKHAITQKAHAAKGKPRRRLVLLYDFDRNPYVRDERLRLAGGVCEKCKSPAPFNRSADESPYLEVHHKRTLASGGEDTLANTIALCPNCHREAHYG